MLFRNPGRDLVVSVFGEEVAELAKQLKQIFTDEGFSAGDANCFDTVGNEEAGEAIEFFEGKDIAFGQEVGALWHAVATAQIAAIGDGQAEVVDGSAAAVDEGGEGGRGNEDGLGRSWRFGEHGGVLGSYLRLCSVPFLARISKEVARLVLVDKALTRSADAGSFAGGQSPPTPPRALRARSFTRQYTSPVFWDTTAHPHIPTRDSASFIRESVIPESDRTASAPPAPPIPAPPATPP